MKKCSMSLNRNMQIKTTLGYCLTGIRMSTTKAPQKSNKSCLQGGGETGALVHCWWECKRCSHHGNSGAFPQNIRNGISIG